MCYVAGNGAVVGLQLVFRLLRVDLQIRFIGKVFICLPWGIALNSPLDFPCIVKRKKKSNYNKVKWAGSGVFSPLTVLPTVFVS